MHLDLIIGIYCNDYLQIAQVPYMDVRFQFEFCNDDARVSSRVKLNVVLATIAQEIVISVYCNL